MNKTANFLGAGVFSLGLVFAGPAKAENIVNAPEVEASHPSLNVEDLNIIESQILTILRHWGQCVEDGKDSGKLANALERSLTQSGVIFPFSTDKIRQAVIDASVTARLQNMCAVQYGLNPAVLAEALGKLQEKYGPAIVDEMKKDPVRPMPERSIFQQETFEV